MKVEIDMNDWIELNTLIGYMKGALEAISMRYDIPYDVRDNCKIACNKYEKIMGEKKK